MPPTGQELVDAAWNGQLLEVKRVLADAGAPSINWVDTYSRSGLHHAALGGHLNVVKYLLENGANLSLKDNRGQTAADLAGCKRVKALLTTEANKGAICILSSDEDEDEGEASQVPEESAGVNLSTLAFVGPPSARMAVHHSPGDGLPTSASKSSHGSRPVAGSATCSVAGCMRVTWNGQPGEQCCRTCNSSDGARHGPACEAKATSPGTVPGSATCSVAGCMRVTWNGLPGEQCCRTCNSSDGARHGPDCETKANRGGFAQKSGSRNSGGARKKSGGARKRKHSSEAYPGAPDRSLWDSKRQEGRDAKKLFRVDAGSEEFAYVKDLFMATMHSKNVVIERIERIENGPQHEAYAQKKKAISDEIAKNLPQDTSDPKNIVRMLFHGTSQQAQRNIIHSDSSGFEPLASGTSTGAIWGEGTYFARDASYSHSFSSMKAGLRQVMLNEVVVGKMTKGRQGIKIYPKVPGTVRGSVMTFHSLVDNEKNPSIFVIKAGSQAYPAFVISYRENTAGDASRAAGGANSQSVTQQTAQKAPQQQGGEGCSIQ